MELYHAPEYKYLENYEKDAFKQLVKEWGNDAWSFLISDSYSFTEKRLFLNIYMNDEGTLKKKWETFNKALVRVRREMTALEYESPWIYGYVGKFKYDLRFGLTLAIYNYHIKGSDLGKYLNNNREFMDKFYYTIKKTKYQGLYAYGRDYALGHDVRDDELREIVLSTMVTSYVFGFKPHHLLAIMARESNFRHNSISHGGGNIGIGQQNYLYSAPALLTNPHYRKQYMRLFPNIMHYASGINTIKHNIFYDVFAVGESLYIKHKEFNIPKHDIYTLAAYYNGSNHKWAYARGVKWVSSYYLNSVK